MAVSAITYDVDEVAGVVRIVHHAQVEFREWAAVMEAILADPRYHPCLGLLVDRRAVKPLTTAQLHRMVDFLGSRMDDGFAHTSWAILVAGTADFGMMRMGQALASEHPTTIEVFRDEEAALSWLREHAAADAP